MYLNRLYTYTDIYTAAIANNCKFLYAKICIVKKKVYNTNCYHIIT